MCFLWSVTEFLSNSYIILGEGRGRGENRKSSLWSKIRASPKCVKCPKKHICPTIWFHSIKLKLLKLIFINRFNDLFLLFFRKDSFAKSKQSKRRTCKLNFYKVLNSLNDIKLLAQCVFWDIWHIWETPRMGITYLHFYYFYFKVSFGYYK